MSQMSLADGWPLNLYLFVGGPWDGIAKDMVASVTPIVRVPVPVKLTALPVSPLPPPEIEIATYYYRGNQIYSCEDHDA